MEEFCTDHPTFFVGIFCYQISLYSKFHLLYDPFFRLAVSARDTLSGRRREGVFFGASSFVTKLVFGLGAQIAGIIVDLVGLVPGTDPAEVSDVVVRDLGLASAIALGVLVTLSLLFFSRYDLDRERARGIQEALRDREAQP